MASTRLVRKALRNRTVSRQRVNEIKRLTSKPIIKNVDIEQIKAEFASKKSKPTAKKEAPAKDITKEVVVNKKAIEKVATPEVKEEKKAAPKKTAAKKTTAKAKSETKPKTKKKDSKAAE